MGFFFPSRARAVEKLLEHITTQEQRSIIMSAISPGAIPLSKDINGHRVVLYCLKHFATEDIKVTCFRDYGSHLVLVPGK